MTPLPQLGELLNLDSIKNLHDQKEWFTKRDEIKEKIGSWIINKTTKEWLDILEPADIWCAEVLDWKKMLEHEGFKILDMVQKMYGPQIENEALNEFVRNQFLEAVEKEKLKMFYRLQYVLHKQGNLYHF